MGPPLREDLLKEVSRLALEGSFDTLLIEATGISEPIPIAQTFAFDDGSGASLVDLAQLDTMVTVVDAASFAEEYQLAADLRARRLAVDEEDTRTIADPLIEQVGRFDYDQAAQSAGWLRELEGHHTPESEAYNIASFVYRQARPFDAERLSRVRQR